MLERLEGQMAVLAAIQLKQTQIQKLQAEELDAVRARTAELQKQTAELQRQLDLDRSTREDRMAEWDRRIERLVSGFGVLLRQQEGKR